MLSIVRWFYLTIKVLLGKFEQKAPADLATAYTFPTHFVMASEGSREGKERFKRKGEEASKGWSVDLG